MTLRQLETGNWKLLAVSRQQLSTVPSPVDGHISQAERHLLSLVRVVAVPATGFVRPLGTEYDEFVGLDHPLGEHARPSTPVADGKALGHIFGSRHQRRNGLEGASQEIAVEARGGHP